VIPLLRAVRWADAFDCDWVTESLPSMFGRIGPVAIEPLKAVSADKTSGCFCRGMAMDGLGLIAWHYPESRNEISAFIHGIFMDEKDDMETRQEAGNVLLDLKCAEYEDDLLTFARQEEECKKTDLFYTAHFLVNDVEIAFKSNAIEIHERDWLTFYDSEEIEARQKRWDKEAVEEHRDETKIGRNEPCPCGSGKKYKKCCLGKMEE
jgi:hypothetical protein